MNKEDIETLEDLKNIFIHLKNYGWVNDIKRNLVADKVIQAIENLIARNKELEERNKESIKALEEWINGERVSIHCIPKSKVREILEKYRDIEELLQEGDK